MNGLRCASRTPSMGSGLRSAPTKATAIAHFSEDRLTTSPNLRFVGVHASCDVAAVLRWHP